MGLIRRVAQLTKRAAALSHQLQQPERFELGTLAVGRLDLDAFLRGVADNAACAGIADVIYAGAGEPVWVQADEYPLEDAITHVLTNADRHRVPGTPITLALHVAGELATVDIHNLGPQNAQELLARVFDYGVSDAEPEDGRRRGQGLFVAKTYLAKMGGSIAARNVGDGVVFEIGLRRG